MEEAHLADYNLRNTNPAAWSPANAKAAMKKAIADAITAWNGSEGE